MSRIREIPFEQRQHTWFVNHSLNCPSPDFAMVNILVNDGWMKALQAGRVCACEVRAAARELFRRGYDRNHRAEQLNVNVNTVRRWETMPTMPSPVGVVKKRSSRVYATQSCHQCGTPIRVIVSGDGGRRRYCGNRCTKRAQKMSA